MYIILSILLVAAFALAIYLQRRQAKRTKAVYTYSALPLLAFAFVFETWHYVALGLAGLIVVVAVISIIASALKRKKNKQQPTDKLEQQQPSVTENTQLSPATQPVVQSVEQQPQVVEEEKPQFEQTSAEVQKAEEQVVVPQQAVVEEVVTTTTQVEPVAQKSKTISNLPKKTKSQKNNPSDDTLIRYNKSFTAKVVLADEEVRDRYNEIKNHLLSFEGVRARMSWYNETFRYKRIPVAKLALRGKTITLYVALNPERFVDSPYIVDDCSDVKRYKDFPAAIKLKGSRTAKFGEEMVNTRLEELQTYQNAMYVEQDFRLPYRPFTTLLEERLIKEIIVHKGTSGVKRLAGAGELILKRVEAEEADELLEDEVAATMVETKHLGIAATGKKGIVNIGELTTIYKDGDTVTLQDLKDRKVVARDVERLKVLADGYLDKQLIVEAQDFSMDAIKMIVLTGGKAVKVD